METCSFVRESSSFVVDPFQRCLVRPQTPDQCAQEHTQVASVETATAERCDEQPYDVNASVPERSRR